MVKGVFSEDYRSCIASFFAACALAIYVVAQILFRFGTVGLSAKNYTAVDLNVLAEQLVMTCSILSIILRCNCMEKKTFLICAISLCVLFLSSVRTDMNYLSCGFVLLLSFAGEDFDRLCNVYLISSLASIAMVILLSSLGQLYSYDAIPNGRLVFSYGFNHPNTAGALIFNMLCAMTFVLWNRRAWPIACFMAVAGCFFSYWFLSARADAILDTLLALSCLIGHLRLFRFRIRLSKRLYRLVLLCVPLTLLAVMLFASSFYDGTNSLILFLDKITNIRPLHAHNYFVRNGGFSLLGRPYIRASYYHTGLPFQNVDSGYCFLPLVYGIGSMIVLMLSYAVSVINVPESKCNFALLTIVLLSAFLMVVEPFGLNLASCFPMLFLSYAVGGKVMRDDVI